MESVERSSVIPNKSRLARAFAKVFHIRAVTGVSPDVGVKKTKTREKIKNGQVKSGELLADDEAEELLERAVKEAFVAKLFASLSAIKAAYAQLQVSQSPYDAEGIQTADEMVVSELKNLSELKQCYAKKQFDEKSPEKVLLQAEIQEHSSLLKTYDIMSKKLDSQVKLKDSEITFLKEKLAEANKDNKSLEKRLNVSGQFSVPDNLSLSGLSIHHFLTYFRQAVKSIRSFVRLLITAMESADWDLDAAASLIEPDVVFFEANHKCFAFESFICKEMFDGFNQQFSTDDETLPAGEKRRRLFFDRFMELKSVRPEDYLAWKPKSRFAIYCRTKYLKLVHPKMEASFFGNLDQRSLLTSGEYPETPFFSAFTDMAKRVWLLHCLALSFNTEVSIFQVAKGTRFSEVYMESLSDEAFFSSDGTPETDPRVAFTVVPGFQIGKTVIQCQVYLSIISETIT